MNTGLTYTSSLTVQTEDSAKAQGSGKLEVLSTPRMIALMENAAMNAVANELGEGEDTVGTMMNVNHVKASKVGANIKATATLKTIEGRKLTFEVKAFETKADLTEILIGEGLHERFIINAEKFLNKLQ